MHGVGLLLRHPYLPSCSDCQAWMYDPKTWKRSERLGTQQRRTPGTPTPCYLCPKSADKRTPSPDHELSRRNQQALELYYQIKAGKPTPDDSIVEWYGGIIRFVEDTVDRGHANVAAVLGAILKKA